MMNEQALYLNLLKGAIIGNLHYANYLATTYANLIKNGKILSQIKENVYYELIFYYGDMMESEEEIELENLLQNPDSELLCKRLMLVESQYENYFIEMISERRERVERIYQDIINRSNISMNDEDILAIKKAESLNKAIEAGNVWKKIQRGENEAIKELYIQTYPKIHHHIRQNSGDEDDSLDIWSNAQTEFKRKLYKTPDEKGYYQWRPVSNMTVEKTSIFTFFIRICTMRWLDVLRKKKNENTHQKKIFDEYFQDEYESHEDDGNDFLKNRIRNAIAQLRIPCQKILTGKWFGGEFGEGLTSRELSPIINYSPKTIDNLHGGCLDDLRKLLN